MSAIKFNFDSFFFLIRVFLSKTVSTKETPVPNEKKLPHYKIVGLFYHRKPRALKFMILIYTYIKSSVNR